MERRHLSLGWALEANPHGGQDLGLVRVAGALSARAAQAQSLRLPTAQEDHCFLGGWLAPRWAPGAMTKDKMAPTVMKRMQTSTILTAGVHVRARRSEHSSRAAKPTAGNKYPLCTPQRAVESSRRPPARAVQRPSTVKFAA